MLRSSAIKKNNYNSITAIPTFLVLKMNALFTIIMGSLKSGHSFRQIREDVSEPIKYMIDNSADGCPFVVKQRTEPFTRRILFNMIDPNTQEKVFASVTANNELANVPQNVYEVLLMKAVMKALNTRMSYYRAHVILPTQPIPASVSMESNIHDAPIIDLTAYSSDESVMSPTVSEISEGMVEGTAAVDEATFFPGGSDVEEEEEDDVAADDASIHS